MYVIRNSNVRLKGQSEAAFKVSELGSKHHSRCCLGNVEEARGILKALEETIPNLAMVRLRRVSLERRRGNLDEAEALLKEGMETANNDMESSFYAVKLARHLVKVQRSLSKAKKVLLDAIEKDQVRIC